MIAKNYVKHPDAMALQLVLRFGHALVWALPRPTTRTLRAIRAARATTFKLAGRIAYPVARKAPQWAKDAARRARELGKTVRKACAWLDFEEPTVSTRLNSTAFRTPTLIGTGELLFEAPEYMSFCSYKLHSCKYRFGSKSPYWGGFSV